MPPTKMPTKERRRSGPRRSLLVAAVVLAITLATPSLALAQTPQDPSAPTSAGAKSESGTGKGQPATGSSAKRGVGDEQEMKDFMDKFFAHQLKEEKIPGASVSVVKDGKVLFAKGYGQANVEKDEPTVADKTLFRIASTSKLFTATAVMQLVEEGKVDLWEVGALDELAGLVQRREGDGRLVGINPDEHLHARASVPVEPAISVREGHSDFGLCAYLFRVTPHTGRRRGAGLC